ncbi:MAG: hypothetical protein AB1Z23_06770 [Eubacteriales bacterium]
MAEIKSMINRNIKKYFRDRGALFFSLLSVFIVTALYLFFLAKMQVDYVKDAIGNIEGIESMINSWIIGGLVCIPAVSVPLIILCFRVDDVVAGTEYDLNVTPAKRINIMMGYIFSAVIVGFVVSIVCLTIGEIFIVAKGGTLLSLIDITKTISMLLLINICFSGLEFFFVLLMRTNSSINVANSILNILLGFLLGLYVPVGMLGGGAETVIKSFPLLQGASVIRRIMVSDIINDVFFNAPQEAILNIRSVYGIDIVFGEKILSTSFIIAILAVFGIMFYIASFAIMKYRKDK